MGQHVNIAAKQRVFSESAGLLSVMQACDTAPVNTRCGNAERYERAANHVGGKGNL
jgi:hypothetical protein